jgi:hypothetical protein
MPVYAGVFICSPLRRKERKGFCFSHCEESIVIYGRHGNLVLSSVGIMHEIASLRSQ